MAVTITDSGTRMVAGSSIGDITNNDYTVTAGSDLLVVYLIGGNETVTTVNWDNAGTPQALSLEDSFVSAAGFLVKVYSLQNPTAGNLQLFADWTNTTTMSMGAIAFTGDGALEIADIVPDEDAGGNETTPQIVVPSDANGMTVAAIITNTNTAESNQTELWDADVGGAFALVATSATGGSSNTHTFANSPDGRWAGTGIHIAEAVEGLGRIIGISRPA